MERATIAGITLAYELHGAGEPVVLLHNGAGVDWFVPLVAQPALTDRYLLLTYHRAGYAGSDPLSGPLTFTDEAARCVGLLQQLGIGRAHVVGHSSSANMALALALDAPQVVGSLALLEPALMAVPSPPQVPQALERFRGGDTVGAVDTFLQGTCGADYRGALEQALPGAFAQAVASAPTFFGQELPALRSWVFGPPEAQRITPPVLLVRGEHSGPVFAERHALLLQWLPTAEPFVLPKATHLLQLQNPAGMAAALAAFWARHPITAGPT